MQIVQMVTVSRAGTGYCRVYLKAYWCHDVQLRNSVCNALTFIARVQGSHAILFQHPAPLPPVLPAASPPPPPILGWPSPGSHFPSRCSPLSQGAFGQVGWLVGEGRSRHD